MKISYYLYKERILYKYEQRLGALTTEESWSRVLKGTPISLNTGLKGRVGRKKMLWPTKFSYEWVED